MSCKDVVLPSTSDCYGVFRLLTGAALGVLFVGLALLPLPGLALVYGAALVGLAAVIFLALGVQH